MIYFIPTYYIYFKPLETRPNSRRLHRYTRNSIETYYFKGIEFPAIYFLFMGHKSYLLLLIILFLCGIQKHNLMTELYKIDVSL